MTTQQGRTKRTSNPAAITTFVLGLLLIAVWAVNGTRHGEQMGVLGIIGVAAVILGIYFNGKGNPHRGTVRDDE